MKNINQSLAQFIEAVRQGLPVHLDAFGNWYVEGVLKRILGGIFQNAEKRITQLTKSFVNLLDQLEQTPIKYSAQNSHDQNYQLYLEAAEAVIEAAQSSHTSKHILEVNELKRRIIGLKYRLEEFNGGLDPVGVQEDLVNDLKLKAYGWKQKQKMFFGKVLTECELRKLREASQYPEFAEQLLVDEVLMSIFLEWILRDKNSVRPFIEFPSTQTKIVRACLSSRIGRIGGELLHVVKERVDEQHSQKILTLPFEGKLISILDEKRIVEFKGHYKMSIAEVFEIFKNKYARVGNLEFLAQGIVNWNVHQLGWWDSVLKDYHRIDVNRPNWWEQMPIFEILSKDQVHMRYGWELDGQLWNAAAYASRSHPTLDVDQNHAYLEIAIPIDGNRYAIYDFGKFAYDFPTTFFENLSIFCRNVHATVAFPDENVFYSHRQHANHSFILTPEEGLKIMERIKRDIIRSRSYNFVFQIESENCAKWVHETLEYALGEHRMPDLFRIPLLNTEPMGLVRQIFSLIKKLPPRMQTTVLTALHLPFGASQGTWIEEDGQKVLKSLKTHHFWKTTEIYLPAVLINQKLEVVRQHAMN